MSQIQEFLPIASVFPHPDNPRGAIDQGDPDIIQLSEDIARRGILQPLLITPSGQILAGHRRYAAAQLAGLEKVPVMVRELNHREFFEEFFLAENMQRQDLSPLEEARTISALHAKLEKSWNKKVTTAELARRIDMPPNTVSLRLLILKLPERVQQMFHTLSLPLQSSRPLYRLSMFPEEVERFADRLVTHQIVASSLDHLITKRLAELRTDEGEDNGDAPSQPKASQPRQYVPSGNASVITRKLAVENLMSKMRRTISVHQISVVLDATCCNCGMMANETVCLSCPLPRFVNAIAGRVSGDDDDV